ncbi:hypothetical protein CF392_16230 [Tamilnaduibacter salinus]|uniref:Uncharacterized protein n=2 Tax=Tamilnaduibacter salinus TaxID=1484056 RepID=A0A2A2HZC4_9GAMM|nr:hypothetical protein CF392_16230 [Tamilnaduibacter salinus]
MSTPLQGTVLEACIQTKDQYIVFLTDDILNEDFLNIHLLNTNFEKIDSVTIGSAYSTGSFRNLSIDRNDQITFSFFNNKTWSIRVLEKPKIKVPFLSGPSGVNWGVNLFHHLDIDTTLDSA